MVTEVTVNMEDEELKTKDVLFLLQKHESECNLVVAAPFGMLLVERMMQ